jgi:hypothetical protein
MAIETVKHGKHEGSVQDNLTQVAKSIDHPLQATTILEDGQITLNKGVELNVEDHGACFMIPDELIF